MSGRGVDRELGGQFEPREKFVAGVPLDGKTGTEEAALRSGRNRSSGHSRSLQVSVNDHDGKPSEMKHISYAYAFAPRYVYLAGPIFGCDEDEANDWRADVAAQLKPHGIIGVSPLRCEPLRGDRYGHGSDEDPRFGTARAIAHKNIFDVRTCDMTLAYFPEQWESIRTHVLDENGVPIEMDVRRGLSSGTIAEVAWAFALNKDAIVVSTDPRVVKHPVINACSGWLVPDLKAGVETIIGILGGYTGGKNV